jgi:PAS domain S-box-containing protein
VVTLPWVLPSSPVLGWLAYLLWLHGPLWIVVLLLWPARRPTRYDWRYLGLDLAILGIAATLLFWYYRLSPSAPPPEVGFIDRNAPLVTSGVMLVGVSIAVLRGPLADFAVPFHFLVASLTVTFVSNFGLTVLEVPPPWDVRASVPLATLSAVFAYAAAESLRLGWRRRRPQEVELGWRPLPWMAVLAVALLVAQVAIRARGSLGPVLIGMIVLTGLLLVRQYLTMRQNARLQAERVALEVEARIAALVRHTSDIILVTDDTFRIRFASPSVENVWTGETEHLLGREVADLVDPEQRDDARRALNQALRMPGQSHPVRWRIRGPDGRMRRVEAVITNLLHQPSVGGVVLTLRDQTERVELEEQLHQSQRMESLGKLAGGVAHDFNNLLTAMLGHSEIGLGVLEPSHPARAELEQITLAVERAGSLTKQLLAFSRRQVVEPRVVDVPATVNGVSRMIQRLIEESIEVVFDVVADAGRVLADPSQLEQVILNLAVNARDAMSQGGTLTIRVHGERVRSSIPGAVIPVPRGDHVVIEVQDTGVGIDPETRARIFEPFFTTKPTGRGTGLGLATVYGIVKQNEGGMVLESEPGKGSTFAVYLPRVEAEVDQPEAVARRHVGPSSGATILLVEDDPTLRDIASRVLTRDGYRVLVASDADQALGLAEEAGRVDLLLADVILPGASGPRLAARLRERRPDLRALFITGYIGDLSAEIAARDRLLRKPFTPYLLVEEVRVSLEGGGEPAFTTGEWD